MLKNLGLTRRNLLIESFELDNPDLKYVSPNTGRTVGVINSVNITATKKRNDEINSDWKKAFQEYTELHIDKSDFDLQEILRNKRRRIFYSRRDALPDYEFWGRNDLWTIADTIPLLLNLNPEVYTWNKIESKIYDSDKDRDYVKIRSLLLTAVRANKFGSWTRSLIEYKSIHPITALKWADNKKIVIATELLDKVREYHVTPEVVSKDGIIAQLRSENKELLSREEALKQNSMLNLIPEKLRTAIDVYFECWHELGDDEKHPSNDEIAMVCKEYNGELSDTMVERIVLITKPEGIRLGGNADENRIKAWKRKSKK